MKGGSPISHVYILGGCFLFLFTAYLTAQNFITSFLPPELAFSSLATIYLTFSFANVLAPTVVLALDSHTRAMRYAACGYTIWHLATICAVSGYIPWVIYPASVVLGLAAAVLWVAEAAIVTRYAGEERLGEFHGIFFAMMFSNLIFGNLLAILFVTVLNKGGVFLFAAFAIISALATAAFTFVKEPPPPPSVKAATAVALELSPASSQQQTVNLAAEGGDLGSGGGAGGGKSGAAAAARAVQVLALFRDPNFVRLIALAFYSGSSKSFFWGALARLMGPEWVGVSFFGSGVCFLFASLTGGRLSDRIGRGRVFAATMALSLTAWGLAWAAVDDGQSAALFVAASCVFGLADSGVNTQLYVAVGALWGAESENAFAAEKFIESLGNTTAFFYGNRLSVHVQLGFLLLLIGCSAGGYLSLFRKSAALRIK